MQTVNILGTEYTIEYKNVEDMPEGLDGYCNWYSKTIVVANRNIEPGTEKDEEEIRKSILRHEITHAFLGESGLCEESGAVEAWAMNEEMIDWFALQSPKIFKVFQEVGALEDKPTDAYKRRENVRIVPCVKDKEMPSEAEIENALKTLEKLNEEPKQADATPDKVYIVVREDRTDNGYESTNERVLSTMEKAIDYIENEGYTFWHHNNRYIYSINDTDRYYRIDPWQVD